MSETVLAQGTESEAVLPAKTVKTVKAARQYSGALFAGKVVIGTVTQIDNKVITVTQKDGLEADITTTEVTKFVKGGRKINLTGVVVGDTVVAQGASSVDGTFLAKSIVAKSKVLKELKKVPFYGTIGEVTATSFTIKYGAKEALAEILVNNQTIIRRLGKKVALKTLLPGQRVVVVALVENDGIFTGKMVQLLGGSSANQSPQMPGTPSPEVQP